MQNLSIPEVFGPFNPDAVYNWSELVGPFQFRISTIRGVSYLWRKEHNEAFYGGYQIKRCVADSKIAQEWLA